MIDLDENELSYLAGMIDSRGSLFCQKMKQKAGKNYNYLPLMCFSAMQTRRLQPITRLFGDKPNNSYQLGKQKTVDLLRAVYPYLKYRKKMAAELLKIEDIRLKAKRGPLGQIDDASLIRMEKHYQNFITLRNE